MGTWTLSTSFPTITDHIEVVTTNSTGTHILVGAGQLLYISSDSGQTWATSTISNTVSKWNNILVSDDGSTIVISYDTASNSIIEKSTNGGSSWTSLESVAIASSQGDANITYVCGSSDLSILYYSRKGYDIRKSTDGGANWSSTSSAAMVWVKVVCSNDGSVVAAVNQGVYVDSMQDNNGTIQVSTNAGTTWSTYGSTSLYYSVAVSGSGNKIVASPSTGLLVLTNAAGTISSNPVSLADTVADIVTSDDGNIICGIGIVSSDNSTAIYNSSDAGANFLFNGLTLDTLNLTNGRCLATSSASDYIFLASSIMTSQTALSGRFYSYAGVGSNSQQPGAPCFLANARVLTPSGYVPISSLAEDDVVVTASGKTAKIEKVIKYAVDPTIQNIPYIIPSGMFGAMVNLPISPDHRVQVPGRGLVKAAELGLSRLPIKKRFTYYNLLVENCENMIVEGVNVESMAHPTRYTLTTQEFHKLLTELDASGKKELRSKLVKASRSVGSSVELTMSIQRKH